PTTSLSTLRTGRSRPLRKTRSAAAGYALPRSPSQATEFHALQGATRPEPYGRLSRIRLPPWVCDGEAIARPGVKDDRFRKPVVHPLRHPVPSHPILLATSPQRSSPEVGDMVPEHMQCMGIGRHGVVVEVAAYDPCQPFPLCGDRLVHAPPHLLF